MKCVLYELAAGRQTIASKQYTTRLQLPALEDRITRLKCSTSMFRRFHRVPTCKKTCMAPVYDIRNSLIFRMEFHCDTLMIKAEVK